MAYRIVIVDDSAFFRRRLKKIIEKDPELEVVGEAENGQIAIDVVHSLKPDVVTMDIEMPVMDGISAVKRIMAQQPLPILMFSSLTTEGAQATLDALDAGAQDFIPKKFQDIALNRSFAILELQTKIKALAKSRCVAPPTVAKTVARPVPKPALVQKTAKPQAALVNTSSFKCIAIGASTGGPVALQQVLSELPVNLPLPVVMVQHMPGSFTEAFAKRLDEVCDIKVKLAKQGEVLKNGECYLAPGGKQMTFHGSVSSARTTISEPEDFPDAAYRPCVDVTFESLANVFGGKVLAIILTGMGSDGTKGCGLLKQQGAKVWAQDESSCVVYGMPQAVTRANIAEENIHIERLASRIQAQVSGQSQ